MPNDGEQAAIVTSLPAPAESDPFHYDQMVRRLVHGYEVAFGSI